MTYELRFELSVLPTIGPNARRHWRDRHRENQAIYTAVSYSTHRQRPAQPLELAHLRLTRHSATEPDPENLGASFKSIVDALKVWIQPGKIPGCAVIAEDRRTNIGRPEYLWARARGRDQKVTIEVFDEDAFVLLHRDHDAARAHFLALRSPEPPAPERI